ncbi:hypothetical protein ACVWZD_006469 [Streptomyces sp. TE3672]
MNLPAARPLARSLDPLPGESLGGFLLRLSYRLGITPHRVATLCGLEARSDSIPHEQLRELSPSAAHALATAARLGPAETTALTLAELTRAYPPLARIRSVETSTGGRAKINWALNPDSRYCPQCLQGNGSPVQEAFGGAWQLRWHLPVVFACTRHRRLLEQICPQCAQPLSGRVVRRLTVLSSPHVGGLHPAQCRNQAPGVPRRFHTRATPCGGRLDITEGLALDLPHRDMEQLTGLQARLDLILAPRQDSRSRSGSTEATYFSDLILTAHLILLSWPLGASLLPSPALADLVDRYATAPEHFSSSKGFHGTRTAPRDAAQCAAVLLAAATALGDRRLLPLREHVEPLVREVYRQSRSGANKLFDRYDVSTVLLRATAPRLYGRQERAVLRVRPRPYRFRVEEIPPLFPWDWYATHLQPLTEHFPTMTMRVERHLRWAGSLRLAELLSGHPWSRCAVDLGIPPASARRTMRVLGKQMNPANLWPAFDEAVERAARDLHDQDNRIDYANRRRAMTHWQLSREHWIDLCAPNPGLERRGSEGDPRVGEAIIWSKVNEACYLHSPAMLRPSAISAAENDVADDAGQIIRRYRGSYSALNQRLETYAARLAQACDEGRDLDISVPVTPAAESGLVR